MNVRDVDGVNAGYAQTLLEQYLENPEAVPEEWRALFENGDAGLVEALPGLARLLENLKDGNGAQATAQAPAPVAVASPPPAPGAAGGRGDSPGAEPPRPRRIRPCSRPSPRRWR